MTTRIPLPVLVLLLSLCLACTTAGAVPEYRLRLVQVLHRHGSRVTEPGPGSDTSKLCPDLPCGTLTARGMEMMVADGRFIRERYNTNTSVVSEPFFPEEDIVMTSVNSRSTNVLRTLQSAEAFLRGVFPSLNASYAAVHTVERSTDRLLNPGARPGTQFIWWDPEHQQIDAMTDPVVDRLFPDWTLLKKMGEQAYHQPICDYYTNRSLCAIYLLDVAAASRAAGTPELYPLLEENYDKLLETGYTHLYVTCAFDRHTRMEVGATSQPLLQELTANMDATVAGTSTFKLMHYSGHDTTLAALWSAFGLKDLLSIAPPFAQLMVLELLERAEDGSLFIRVLRGAPGQFATNSSVFALDDTFHMNCMDASGNFYVAPNDTCPLEDFKRLVEWSRPTSALGFCYLNDRETVVANCPAAPVTFAASASAKVSYNCASYRKLCPTTACPSGSLMDPATSACVCTSDACVASVSGGNHDENNNNNNNETGNTGTKSDNIIINGVSGGAAAGIAIATFSVGLILAAAITAALCLCHQRSKANNGGGGPDTSTTCGRSTEAYRVNAEVEGV